MKTEDEDRRIKKDDRKRGNYVELTWKIKALRGQKYEDNTKGQLNEKR